MRHIKAKTALDTIATITMIAASVAVLVAILWPRPAPEDPNAVRRAARTYKVGDTFPTVPGLETQGRPLTLVAFVRSDCKFCEASVPFYKSLLTSQRQTKAVAMSFDPASRLRTYLDGRGLQFDEVISVRPGTVRVAATPTLLLLDSRSVVQAVWIGELSKEEEATVKNRMG